MDKHRWSIDNTTCEGLDYPTDFSHYRHECCLPSEYNYTLNCVDDYGGELFLKLISVIQRR